MDQPTADILFFDLTTGRRRRESPAGCDLRADRGGRGLAGAIFAASPAVPWDDPAACLCLFPGALAGYDLPGASFASLVGANPHTGGVLTASVPGGIGQGLARCGLAGLVLTGRADVPMLLMLDGQGLRLVPAGDLAGQGLAAIAAALAPWHGLLAVGPAARAGSRLAIAVADGVHPVGRGGSGLLLAAKNIVAVVVAATVAGEPAPVPVDAAAMGAARAAMERLIAAAPALSGPCGFGRFGTAALLDLTAGRRMLPTRNFRQTVFAQAAAVSAPRLDAVFTPRAVGCPGCPVPCRRVTDSGAIMPDGDALSHFTALLGLADGRLAVAANSACLDMGLDPPGAAAVLAGRAEADGRDPDPGEVPAAVAALAKAPAALPALCVKGVALPAFDPRGACGLALSLAVGPAGPDAWGGLCLAHELLRKPVATDRFTFAGKARAVYLGENAVAAAASLGGCPLCTLAVGLEEWGLAVSAATGTIVAAGELARLGERAVFRERQRNARAGIAAAADDLPERFFTEPGSSGEGIDVPPLSRPAFLAARAGYYRLRGVAEDGRPSPGRAEELELPWLA
ncbi:aldehyde ferredoxin oxidoreductase C-terminal domain-containing protein [Desulfovibrio sp. TomC]|uniref:aldehyde ferredoxin oxidoreductase C-terminal domain-containing protein n=1 Tax=Desulfovibrio sp. TomC TaxID=1562888 RepID=UPI00057389EB|nr:aldehyde ferredoxin oxidoreductase C-terminal domain-containing protein [Desulfovibrio sp. TomC]KHK03895.1 Tungsten-containing aldehyde:ferredoxin oxidoreductase [Desulfovibrio sp. TomC]